MEGNDISKEYISSSLKPNDILRKTSSQFIKGLTGVGKDKAEEFLREEKFSLEASSLPKNSSERKIFKQLDEEYMKWENDYDDSLRFAISNGVTNKQDIFNIIKRLDEDFRENTVKITDKVVLGEKV